MLRRLGFGLLGVIGGYVVGLFGGMGLVALFSGNHFDGSVEGAMTGAFIVGPILALAGLVLGVVLGRPKAPVAPAS